MNSTEMITGDRSVIVVSNSAHSTNDQNGLLAGEAKPNVTVSLQTPFNTSKATRWEYLE